MKPMSASKIFGVMIVISMVSLSSAAWAVPIPSSEAIQGVGVGKGLKGNFFQYDTESWEIGPTLSYLSTNPTPTGTFISTVIGTGYGAMDDESIQTVLVDDGTSYVGQPGIIGGSVLRMAGFIDIASVGNIGF
jgi:hypothetical protein